MFVRWKKRISTDKNKERKEIQVDGKWTRKWLSKEEMPYTLSAYLVQSKRVDGKPRQEVIAFLGSVTRKDIEKGKPVFRLWRDIEEVFSKLQLDIATKEMVYKAFAEKTPRPSAEEIDKEEQEHKAMLAKYGMDKPSPPRPPDTPPLLGTQDTMPDVERPLFIKWKREYKGEYHAFLAKAAMLGEKEKVEIITKLASLEYKDFGKTRTWNDKVLVQASWKSFWYTVHMALCKAKVDYSTYHEAMRLLGKRIEQPSHEELLQLIQEKQTSAEKSIESDIDETVARYGRLQKKQAELKETYSFSSQYLSNNVESQSATMVGR
jgi:hypothetical protein